MRNMSVRNGTAGDLYLDIIDEYLTEKTIKELSVTLPGPPPPPVDQDIQPVDPPSRGRRSTPVLVSRGAAPHNPYIVDQTPTAHTDGMAPMHSMRGQKVASQRRGQSSVAPQRLHPQQTGTEYLERFLEKPKLVVVEQPKERGMRFRYECEGRSAGSILGASSTDSSKTLPAIEIQGLIDNIKKVIVTVSLVTKDIPYRPHPHCLVGKDCTDGICVIHINPHSARRHSFANLGIQCVRRKELDASLEKRRNKNIDPFNTGHSKSIEDMDMNVVRLCFQCELERKDGDRIPLAPVVSNPIYDKKATTTAELKINRLNVVRGPCTGKTEIYMLCDKVQKDDIEIIFSKDDWEAKAEFAQTDVHRQIAIVFKSPPFREQNVTEEVEVSVCLRRMSDRMDSEPVMFTYVPDNADPYGVNRKRKMKSDVKFSEPCSVPQDQDIVNELTMPQHFDNQFYTPPDCNVPNASMAVPVMDGGNHMPSQVMEEIHYNEDFKQEDGCVSLDPDTLNTVLQGISQCLASFRPDQSQHGSDQLLNQLFFPGNLNFGLDGADTKLNVNQPMMNMSSINDVHFSQMVNENQAYPADLENIEGLIFSTVKNENDLDH
ncbi:transcription factor RelB homolog [Sinocyclocheilus rhinocerous]|uniref:Transcription factor RelB homolog n=1 Tax=Sinocyclocheilus rhinocerous TaxID=307959 RepID=A0A673K092_9TELE|nr:PREDICTED: transcription factor RelB homolog [Sinocyclocheilus rhinocerous]